MIHYEKYQVEIFLSLQSQHELTALPTDELDIDNDGGFSEILPIDLDGNSRVSKTLVDIGPYERVFLELVFTDGFE